MLSNSSCLGHLDVRDKFCDCILEIMPLLLQWQSSTLAYPHISIHLTIKTPYLKQYSKVMECIPHWTPYMKKLFILEFYGCTNHPLFCMKFSNSTVWSNLHLKTIGLEVKNIVDFDDEKTKMQMKGVVQGWKGTVNEIKSCKHWMKQRPFHSMYGHMYTIWQVLVGLTCCTSICVKT